MKHPLTLGLLMLGLALVISVIGWIKLHHSVKVSLEYATSSKLDAQTQFSGLRLDLIRGRMTVQRVECRAHRPQASSWKSILLENAELDFDLLALFSGETPADLRVDSLEVERAPDTYAWISPLLLPASGEPLTRQWPRWKFRSLQIKQALIRDPSDQIEIQGLLLKNYDLEIETIRYRDFVFNETLLTFYWESPEFRIDHFITHHEEGIIRARGRWNTDANDLLTMEYGLEKVPARVFLSDRWKVLFKGLITGKGNFTGPLLTWEAGTSTGSFEAGEARLQAFPILENLSLLTGIAGLTSVQIDTAKADLHYHDRQFDFKNIVIRKENTLRWEGNLSVLPDQTLRGDTSLGLSTDATDLIPQLRQSIFTEQREGFDWTPVKISGDIDQPREDLTPRLRKQIQSEAGKALQEGGDLIEKGIEKAKELFDDWLKKKE
jgi:hypothetical protein